MSSLPTRASRASKHNRKPYERPLPSPAPLARSKSGFFNTVKAIVAAPFAWLSASEQPVVDGGERQLKRRPSRNRPEQGRPKRLRTASPPRIPPATGYLDPPEHLLRPANTARPLATDTSSHSSVRNTPLGFHPPRSPSRRTPSIGSWFPQPASTRNSLASRSSQVHFGTLPNLNIDAAIAAHDDTRMQSCSPSVRSPSVSGVGLGRERTPSRAVPAREASLSLSLAGRSSLSRATGSSLRATLSAANPFSSLGKSSSVAPERKKSSLIWDDDLGVTSADEGKPKAPSAPPAKNTAERLLNALENMHTHTGDAQRPRRRPPFYVQVPTPGPSVPDKLKRMIQPYGEVKVSPGKAKKAESGRPKSGLMKMLMKTKKEVQEDDMDMEEAPKPTETKEPAQPTAEKAKVTVADVDTDMESQPAPAPTTTTVSPALKVIDNFRPASQPPSRPGSSLRQSKTITKRAHAPSAGRNRFSANNEEEEEDEEAVEKRNAELLAVANANVFKVPEGFKFGGAPTPAIPASKPTQLPKPEPKVEVVSPQPVHAKPAPTPILSFTPLTSAPAKEASSPTPSFFSDKAGAKAALPEIKNPFASLGASKPEIKVPDVPWGSVPSSSAPTPPPKPVEGASPFANIGVSAKTGDGALPFSFGKPKEADKAPSTDKPASGNPFANVGKVDKPAGDNPFANIGKPADDNPFASTGKPAGNPFASVGKPAGDNPFAGIGTNNKSTASAPAPAPTSWFPKPAEPKPAEISKPEVEAAKPAAEPPKPVVEIPAPAVEPPKPSPFSFGASQPAEKPAVPPPAFSFGAPATTTPSPAPSSTPAPVFSFGAPSVPVPTPAPSAAAKPTFAFGLPASTPSPTLAEPPKKNPFDFSAPAAASAPAPVEAPKKNPFDFSSATPAAGTPSGTPTPGAPATTTKSPFDFSSAAKPADKPASPFAFGAPAAAPTPAAAPAATEKKNPFDFSGTTQKPASNVFSFGAPSAPAGSTTNGFTFGAPAPARPSTPPSGGDAAMEESPTREPTKIVTSGFGTGFGTQQSSTGFTFGSATNGTSASTGPFGGAANGASTTGPFGGPLNGAAAAQPNGFGSAAPASPAPFAFGASNNAGTGFGSGGSGFGTNGTAAPSTTPAFSFGGTGGFGQTPSATSSPSNPFTQPTPSPFGQPNPAPANAFPTPASPFPAASPALSTVGFNTGNAPSSNNAFGSAQSATNGFPGSPATPAFAFGAPAPTAGTASPSTFTFGLPGGTSAPATPTSTTSPFVFGQGAAGGEGSPAPSVQFNLGTADASPGGRKIKPLRRPRRN